MAEVLCVLCPGGCRVRVAGDRAWGARCRRGAEHARREATDPRRTVTTTVAVAGAPVPVVPVRSSGPVPRDCQAACVREMARLRVRAPVGRGEVILRDLLGLGVDVVVTRTVPDEGGPGTERPPGGGNCFVS